MAETCPYLDYRDEGDGKSFDTPRAYCKLAGRFVEPMRADICHGRYDLAYGEHCEIYRANAD